MRGKSMRSKVARSYISSERVVRARPAIIRASLVRGVSTVLEICTRLRMGIKILLGGLGMGNSKLIQL